MRTKQLFFFIAFALALLALNCTRTLEVSGSATDIGNPTVSGRVYDSGGRPSAHAVVRLIPSLYNPFLDSSRRAIHSDTTDTTGYYTFVNIDTGTYNVLAIHANGKTSDFASEIHLNGDTSVLLSNTLQLPGSLKVKLASFADTVNGYIYIPGTTFFMLLSNVTGFAVLDVPAGIHYQLNYAIKNASLPPVLIRDSLAVVSAGTTTVSYWGWQLFKKVLLNTTLSGADVSETVANFPVLVRLTKDNFDFSSAMGAGEDIRFAKPNGEPLSYEIERWNASAELAEIWVKVDTVFGNNSTQYITMYWGAAQAASTGTATIATDVTSQSNGASVFDTSNGFQAVWHMNQIGGATVLDATVNQYNGTPTGMTESSSASGAVGEAYIFNGTSSSIDIDQHNAAASKLNFNENGNYTISAWVNLDTLFDSQTEVIVEKGAQRPSEYVLTVTNQQEIYFIEYESSPAGWNNRAAPAETHRWVYLVGVKKGTNQYLYADGVLRDSIGIFKPDTYARGAQGPVAIGRNPYDANYLKGMIDEVRLSNISRSPGWIKLCAMNQKPDDALVKIK